MLLLATDWATLSALATALGTLVLAVATFAAVRSSNRSALIAEVALQEQRRPVLVPSSLDDPLQKLNFADGVWIKAAGGHAAAKLVDGNVYLAINVRNVGNGIGVLQGWAVRAGQTLTSQMPVHMPDDDFRMQTRDLYIPGNGVGMWQGAMRNREDPMRRALAAAIEEDGPITVELLYSDLTGRQRAITRFGLLPLGARPTDRDEADEGDRLASMSRLWFLDFEGPRPDSDELLSAVAAVQSQTGSEAARS
ncbi:MAG: hypothetical protein KGL15_04625 [Acidobacteriota bacterium]|nr:hypothetical protein [Acidobacteriota bacterium]